MEENKVRVAIDIELDCFQSLCFLYGGKLTPELCEALQSETWALTPDLLDSVEDFKSAQLMFALVALTLASKKLEQTNKESK